MFRNYGDRNFFEAGMLVDIKDKAQTEFDILYCQPVDPENDHFQFAELSVDLKDSWLQERIPEVVNFSGEKCVYEDNVLLALAAVTYFGPENFGACSIYAYDWQNMTREEICEILRHREIEPNTVYFD